MTRFTPTPRAHRDEAMLRLLVESAEEDKAAERALAHAIRRIGASRRHKTSAIENLKAAQKIEDGLMTAVVA